MVPAAKKAKKPGRPAFKPTDENRAMVRKLAAVGTPQKDIGTVLGINEDTLRKYFREELDTGSIRATASVAGKLYEKAIAGDTTCMIFWMKTRGGWREKSDVELSGEIGVRRVERVIVKAEDK